MAWCGCRGRQNAQWPPAPLDTLTARCGHIWGERGGGCHYCVVWSLWGEGVECPGVLCECALTTAPPPLHSLSVSVIHARLLGQATGWGDSVSRLITAPDACAPTAHHTHQFYFMTARIISLRPPQPITTDQRAVKQFLMEELTRPA